MPKWSDCEVHHTRSEVLSSPTHDWEEYAIWSIYVRDIQGEFLHEEKGDVIGSGPPNSIQLTGKPVAARCKSLQQ